MNKYINIFELINYTTVINDCGYAQTFIKSNVISQNLIYRLANKYVKII